MNKLAADPKYCDRYVVRKRGITLQQTRTEEESSSINSAQGLDTLRAAIVRSSSFAHRSCQRNGEQLGIDSDVLRHFCLQRSNVLSIVNVNLRSNMGWGAENIPREVGVAVVNIKRIDRNMSFPKGNKPVATMQTAHTLTSRSCVRTATLTFGIFGVVKHGARVVACETQRSPRRECESTG